MKHPPKRRFSFALAITLGVVLAACSARHENSIVGKWRSTSQGGNSATLTFTKDGKVFGEGRKAMTGEYSLSTSNTVFLKIETNSIEFDLAFASPDEMTLTAKMVAGMPVPKAQAEPAKFTRVSQ